MDQLSFQPEIIPHINFTHDFAKRLTMKPPRKNGLLKLPEFQNDRK